jgi:hypothetical protein
MPRCPLRLQHRARHVLLLTAKQLLFQATPGAGSPGRAANAGGGNGHAAFLRRGLPGFPDPDLRAVGRP